MTTFALLDDMKCEYKLTIHDAKSVLLEVQGYNNICRFIHRLNFYKRLVDPSSEDRIESEKEISYATISLDKLKKNDKDCYSLIIPCDVKDVLDALKFTKTIDEKTYNQIYTASYKDALQKQSFFSNQKQKEQIALLGNEKEINSIAKKINNYNNAQVKILVSALAPEVLNLLKTISEVKLKNMSVTKIEKQ